VSFESSRSDHDAVFLGFGLGPDTLLDVPGEELPGVVARWTSSSDEARQGRPRRREARVVLGGGNTALDACASCSGLGIPEVTMVYRGDEAAMSGYAHEWAAAKVEGARAEWRAQPSASRRGRRQGRRVRCQRLDDDKKPIAGAESFDARRRAGAGGDRAVEARGLVAGSGHHVDGGRVVTDERGATGRPGCTPAGDCRNGGKEVVNAAAEGKAAARRSTHI
jgi:dihydropyrimidine dehydrogenase (NAD+) subunit PreT